MFYGIYSLFIITKNINSHIGLPLSAAVFDLDCVSSCLSIGGLVACVGPLPLISLEAGCATDSA